MFKTNEFFTNSCVEAQRRQMRKNFECACAVDKNILTCRKTERKGLILVPAVTDVPLAISHPIHVEDVQVQHLNLSPPLT